VLLSGKRAEMEQVRIQIRFTATFAIGSPILPPPAQRMNSVQNCLHDFDFRFSQAKDLPPIRSCAVPIYSSGDSSVPTGGDVWFTLRASDVVSAPLRVTVSTPDQVVSATFDLAALR